MALRALGFEPKKEELKKLVSLGASSGSQLTCSDCSSLSLLLAKTNRYPIHWRCMKGPLQVQEPSRI